MNASDLIKDSDISVPNGLSLYFIENIRTTALLLCVVECSLVTPDYDDGCETLDFWRLVCP